MKLLLLFPWKLLAQQALEESAMPVRTGKPFWNQNAVQFQFAPAFDFKEVNGAEVYRFTLNTVTGEKLVFEADKPTAALSPVWTKVPVGKTTLIVEPLDAKGAVGIKVHASRSMLWCTRRIYGAGSPQARSTSNFISIATRQRSSVPQPRLWRFMPLRNRHQRMPQRLYKHHDAPQTHCWRFVSRRSPRGRFILRRIIQQSSANA
jgi:hypothetical protein